MLGQLHIKNIGIIDDITMNFTDGLNILTGETGAGKSLIIDSLNILTGSRISKELIKNGTDMAIVEGCFFQNGDNIILVREIYQNGRNICKINGKMVTLGEFKEKGENLIDIHGQHDNQSLLNPKTHIDLLDSFAGEELLSLKNEYTEFLIKHKEIKSELQKNYGDDAERARKIDLLKYQLNEIDDAKLKIGEEEELNEKRSLLMNAEKIAKALDNSYKILDDNVINGMDSIIHELSSISSINEKYNSILESIQDAYYNLKDTNSTINDNLQDVNFDENEQEEIEERLDLLFSLKRKYGNDIEKIIEYKCRIEHELDQIENAEEIIQKLQIELKENESKLNIVAKKISDIRKKTANIIEEKINVQLQDLEMKKSSVQFQFEKVETFLENGTDKAQILIETNKGEGLKPLSKIASGGEISRVMLAIKTILCDYDDIPTMIFDEIDTGISGQAGIAVSEKLKLIGKTHQVICVTHLPSIAASGNCNFFVSKEVVSGKTITEVKKLDEEETISEIARILAGNNITNVVIEHAKELRSSCK